MYQYQTNIVEGRGEKWIEHYCSSHKILLVGEGDFGFAVCLAKAFGSAINMVATSLDSEGEVMIKYSAAEANLKELKERGCTMLHGVDASNMSHHSLLKLEFFDRIVFNFPHAGYCYMREHNYYQIERHQKLVRGFLSNARDMLKEDGEVHITHKTAHPFNMWRIQELAMEVGLCLKAEVDFHIYSYPGYVNKRGYAPRYDGTFPVGACSTFKFVKAG